MGSKLGDRIRFDTRLAQRSLARGMLDRDEWEKHLEELPDSSDKAASLLEDQESGD